MAISKVRMQHIASDFEIGKLPALNSQQFIMSTMGERSLQLEVIALFIAQLTTVRNRDPQSDAKFPAHTLRGAALAIGAEEIATIAGLWEDRVLSQLQLDEILRLAEARFQTATGQFFQKS
jgi:HPt (histidine-containing phosphotransfer) domain-containing protein